MKIRSFDSLVAVGAFLALAAVGGRAQDITHFPDTEPMEIPTGFLATGTTAASIHIGQVFASTQLRLTVNVLWSEGPNGTHKADFHRCISGLVRDETGKWTVGANLIIVNGSITNDEPWTDAFSLELVPSGNDSYLLLAHWSITINGVKATGQTYLGRLSYSKQGELLPINPPAQPRPFRLGRNPRLGYTVALRIPVTTYTGVISDGRFVITGSTTEYKDVYTQPPLPVVIDDRAH